MDGQAQAQKEVAKSGEVETCEVKIISSKLATRLSDIYTLFAFDRSSFVCVQLLQTLNILFENIRNETSLCKIYMYKVYNYKYIFLIFRLPVI